MPECPNCEKEVFGSRCRVCGWTIPQPVSEVIDRVMPGLPRGMHIVKSKPLPAERPCSLEQSKAANQVLQDVLDHRATAEEGRKRLAEIFNMPELATMEEVG